MQFMLMDYVQVQGFFRLTQDEKNHWLGAYRAYLEAMRNAGVKGGAAPPRAMRIDQVADLGADPLAIERFDHQSALPSAIKRS